MVLPLQTVRLKEKRAFMGNMARSLGIIAGPAALFSVVGASFAATECAAGNLRGKQDSLNGVLGAITAGSIIGVRVGSISSALGYSAVFAAGSLVADFITNIVHPVFDDLKVSGPLKEHTSRV